MTRLIFILPLVLVVAVGAVFIVMLQQDRNPRIIPSPLIGQPVPQIDLVPLPNLDGVDGIATADFLGDVTVVNFFASWCVPCLAEHPLVTKMADAGYRVWGINYRDEVPYGGNWLKRHGNPYQRVGADFDARAGLEFGVTGVPETYIVDRDGIIRHKHAGPLTADIVAQEILPLLRELSQ